MIIVITGTPGTGKSAVAHELARLIWAAVVDVKEIVENHKLFTKNKYGELEIDPKKLKKTLEKELNGFRVADDIIIENHVLCEFKIPADYVFILRCHPDRLRKRLEKRKYRKQKLLDNLEAEMLDYCSQKVKKHYKLLACEMDTTGKTALQTAKRIALAIKNRNKKKFCDIVDYSGQLKKHLMLKQG